MLEISDLTFRLAGRTLFDNASAFIAEGWKVGLIGRNGAGKSTLLRMICEDAGKPGSAIRLKRGARMGFVAQEAAPTDTTILDSVLESHTELAALTREAETVTDPDRIGELYARLEALDAYSAPARASAILAGLGFSQADPGRPCREFSGGWRMRAALAGVLFSQPDLLVLDEPSNYLDLEGAAWLEDYLKTYPYTLIVVSHDREMLNRSVSHILALDGQKLEIHSGGYDIWLRKRAERMAGLSALKARQDADRAHLQAFVDRFRAKASKARQAQSRIKRLEKMQEIAVPIADRAAPFHFTSGEVLPSPLVTLDHADLGYVAGTPVLRRVSFRLDPDDRIVIIGPNGQGKTTLVKSIAARLPLLAGQRVANRQMRIGYFSQDQLDELRAGETVLSHIRDLAPAATPAAHRAMAAQLGFGREKVEIPVEKLSGGEKVRLLLGLATAHKPHLLILDEPTSHLDIDSREALILALNDYAGALLLITHDVYLAEAVADRLLLVFNGEARIYDGDLTDYRSLVLSADRPSSRAQPMKPAAAPPLEPPPASRPSNTQKKLKAAEDRLARAEAERAAIDRDLADPAIWRADPQRAEALQRKRAGLETLVAEAEAEWLGLSLALENAG